MRAKHAILEDVEDAVASGRSEIMLLGQIVNHYQAPDDPACDFAGLLDAVDAVPGVRRIRFTSPHPRHTSRRLIERVRDLPRVCKHFHLPVQSGSTRVLSAMRRRHTRDDYLRLLELVRQLVPAASVSTDVIVGFPGESEEDFADTLSLVEAAQYLSVFSFKYSPRPNTLAAKRMPDDIPEPVKADRLQRLQARQRDIQWALHRRLVGQELDVLIDSRGRQGGQVAGRTEGNTVVNVAVGADTGSDGLARWIGRLERVRMESAGPNSLVGVMVGEAVEERRC
jgi:tRNA-2-methylthio-N6-dimethylallyladenosine synthase